MVGVAKNREMPRILKLCVQKVALLPTHLLGSDRWHCCQHCNRYYCQRCQHTIPTHFMNWVISTEARWCFHCWMSEWGAEWQYSRLIVGGGLEPGTTLLAGSSCSAALSCDRAKHHVLLLGPPTCDLNPKMVRTRQSWRIGGVATFGQKAPKCSQNVLP